VIARFVFSLLLLFPTAVAANSPAPATIFAAASLSEAFQEAARQVTKKSGYEYRFHFAGSQQLAAQLEQGAPADLFASADDRWMEYASQHNLIDGNARRFARNRLVVITPVSNPGRVDKLEDLGRPGVKVLIGTESLPAGRYTRQVLANLSNGTDFGRRVLSNVVSQEDNVKSIVAKVQLGEADAGFVYVTDVSTSVRGRVRAMSIPEASNVIADYPIALAHGAPNHEAAQAFVDYLLSTDGQALLARYGFLAAGTDSP
jgi:molybdate transport system substrate-binding protein